MQGLRPIRRCPLRELDVLYEHLLDLFDCDPHLCGIELRGLWH
jgi:exonuclease V gamma subunit